MKESARRGAAPHAEGIGAALRAEGIGGAPCGEGIGAHALHRTQVEPDVNVVSFIYHVYKWSSF